MLLFTGVFIIMEYRHFSGFDMNSNFEKLSGDKRRAIETQVNIDVEAHKLSKYYKSVMQKEGTEQNLFNILCDEYANKSEIEIKKLVILESKALYYYPLTKDRFKYYKDLAKQKAEVMDKNIFIQTKEHFKDFSR